MNIRSLFLSLVISVVPIASAQACAIGYYNSVLLDEVTSVLDRLPEQLNEATFQGNVELTRVTILGDDEGLGHKVLIRAILIESETHPNFIGRKMMFFYDTKACHFPVAHVGDRGLAMGRALKLGSEILYVAPYVLSFDGIPDEIIIEDETISILEYYPDGYWDRSW